MLARQQLWHKDLLCGEEPVRDFLLMVMLKRSVNGFAVSCDTIWPPMVTLRL